MEDVIVFGFSCNSFAIPKQSECESREEEEKYELVVSIWIPDCS